MVLWRIVCLLDTRADYQVLHSEFHHQKDDKGKVPKE